MWNELFEQTDIKELVKLDVCPIGTAILQGTRVGLGGRKGQLVNNFFDTFCALVYGRDEENAVDNLLLMSLIPHLDLKSKLVWFSFSAKQLLFSRWYEGSYEGQHNYSVVDIRRSWREMGILPYTRIQGWDWFDELECTLGGDLDNRLWRSVLMRPLSSVERDHTFSEWFGNCGLQYAYSMQLTPHSHFRWVSQADKINKRRLSKEKEVLQPSLL